MTRPSECQKIGWGKANVVGMICPLTGILLTNLAKYGEDLVPMSSYVPRSMQGPIHGLRTPNEAFFH